MEKKMLVGIFITLVIVFLASLVLISVSILNYRLSGFNAPIQNYLLGVGVDIDNTESDLIEIESSIEELIKDQQSGTYKNFDTKIERVIYKLEESEKQLNASKEDIEKLKEELGD